MPSVLHPYQLGIAGKSGEFRYFGENPDRLDLKNLTLLVDNGSKHRDVVAEISEGGHPVAFIFVPRGTVAKVPLSGHLAAYYTGYRDVELEFLVRFFRLVDPGEQGVSTVGIVGHPGPLSRMDKPNLEDRYILRLPIAVPA